MLVDAKGVFATFIISFPFRFRSREKDKNSRVRDTVNDFPWTIEMGNTKEIYL